MAHQEVQLLESTDKRRLLSALIDERRVEALLDTGSDTCVSADLLNHHNLMEPHIGVSALGLCVVRKVRLSISVGCSLSRSQIGAFASTYASGVIKAEINPLSLFPRNAFLVDFKKNILRVYDNRVGTIADVAGYEKFDTLIYFAIEHRHAHPRMVIKNGIWRGGAKVTALIDTGASISLLSVKLAEPGADRKAIRLMDEAGNQRVAFISTGGLLGVGATHFQFNSAVYCESSPHFDMRLGMDVLSGCKIIVPAGCEGKGAIFP